jgi:hypothetical protein
MKPARSVGLAGDAGRASDGAGGRAAPPRSWWSAGSLENAAAAGHTAAIRTSGTTRRHDLCMRSLMAF